MRQSVSILVSVFSIAIAGCASEQPCAEGDGCEQVEVEAPTPNDDELDAAGACEALCVGLDFQCGADDWCVPACVDGAFSPSELECIARLGCDDALHQCFDEKHGRDDPTAGA